MINATQQLIDNLHSPVRQVVGKVELYDGSTLAETFTHDGVLKSLEVERVGEQAFFGFGVCHKLTVKITDITRQKIIPNDRGLKAYLEDIAPYPVCYVTETQRDENTGDLTITAYDRIYKASSYHVSQLVMTVEEEQVQGYDIRTFATACAGLIGADGILIENVGEQETCFDTYYSLGANFEGSETIREALDAIAEVTQTIYFLNADNKLVFKRLSALDDAVYTIDKSMYFTLKSGVERKVSALYHVTELGDNLSASTGEEGTIVYIRDNPFWDMYEDTATLLDNALTAVTGLSITHFNCSWRGNFLLELGDKIGLITKDNEVIYSYVLNDTLTYSGALSEVTQWEYTDNETETAETPTGVGEILKKTYAKVDKVNREIQLVASESSANKEAIGSIQVNINNISSTVKQVETYVDDAIDGVNSQLEELSTRIDQNFESVKIEISKELTDEGISTVKTKTGYTFDENGMRVEKSDSELSTVISDNGMTVSHRNTEMLIANKDGVKAANLHANTYLIIGQYSRFEDHEKSGEPRTGCFWIG